MNILDLILLVIFVGSILYGIRKGFIKALYRMISLVLAFGMTYYLYPIIAKIVLTQTKWHEKVAFNISEAFNFSDMFVGIVGKEDEFAMINQLKLPETIKMMLKESNNADGFGRVGASTFNEYISGMLANMVINVLVFIVLFIVVLIVLAIVASILDLVAKLPVLHMTNKLAGGLLGFGLGFIISIVFIGLLSLFMTLTNHQNLQQLVEGSMIAKYLYEYNPIIGSIR